MNKRLEFSLFLKMLTFVVVTITFVFLLKNLLNLVADLGDSLDRVESKVEQVTATALVANREYTLAGLKDLKSELLNLKQQTWFLDDADALLSEGIDILAIGEELVDFLPRLSNLPEQILTQDLATKNNQELLAIVDKLNLLATKITKVKNQILALPAINKQLLHQIEGYDQLLARYQAIVSRLPDFLGYELPHRYLILLQNNNEFRPGGGFIGSLILADMVDGVLVNFVSHDVYQFDGQLVLDEPVNPALRGITNEASLRDSNIFPLVSANAEDAMRFLEAGGGPSVDTVIFLNQSAVGELLDFIGGVPFSGNLLTSDNFALVFTYLIETAKVETNQPKDVLFDFIPTFKTRLKSKLNNTEAIRSLMGIIRKQVLAKDIQAYSRKEPNNLALANLGFSEAEFSQDIFDKLLINHISVGGNKTDRYLEINYAHETQIGKSGRIADRLSIELTHSFDSRQEVILRSVLRGFGFRNLDPAVLFVLGKGNNLTRFKVYVPEGAKLKKHSANFVDKNIVIKKAKDLPGYSVITFLTELQPGTAKKFTVEYELPKRLKISPIAEYKLFVHKSPGINNAFFQKSYFVKEEANFALKKTTPGEPILSSKKASLEATQLNTNQTYSAVISK
jgi:hypothetical protein